jgi:hypothetical protein
MGAREQNAYTAVSMPSSTTCCLPGLGGDLMALTKPYRFEARAAEPLLSAAVDAAKSFPDSWVTFGVELERDLEGEAQVGVGFCRTTRLSPKPDMDPMLFAAIDLAKTLPDNWRRVTFSVDVELAAEGPPAARISSCEIEEQDDHADDGRRRWWWNPEVAPTRHR